MKGWVLHPLLSCQHLAFSPRVGIAGLGLPPVFLTGAVCFSQVLDGLYGFKHVADSFDMVRNTWLTFYLDVSISAVKQ